MSQSRKEMEKKQLTPDESPQSSGAVGDVKLQPTSLKRKQENQSMGCSQAGESSVAKSTEPRFKNPRTKQTEQGLSSPVQCTEVINNHDNECLKRVKKSNQNDSMSQANCFSRSTDVSMSAAKQIQPSRYNDQENIPDRSSLSNVQAPIENVPSHANVDDQVSSEELSHYRNGLISPKLIAQIQSQMKEGRRLIPIGKTVERRICPVKMESNSDIAENASNSIDKDRTGHLSTRSVQQTPVVTQYQSQNDPQFSGIHSRSSRDQTAPPRKRKIRINISLKPKNRDQVNEPSFQGVTKNYSYILTKILKSMRQALSTTDGDILSNSPQLQAGTSSRSTGDNNSPQNIIASDTSNRQNSEMPCHSHSICHPSRIQRTTAHENGNQNLCTEQSGDQSTRTNSNTNQIRSAGTGRHRNNDKGLIDELMSPSTYRAGTSDSDVDTDHEDHDNIRPVETANVYRTANDSEHSSADSPTAAQNSTARNQTNSKVILEQQMLDNFATLSTQMGSTLRHMTDMCNTLRTSIVDSTETYKNLLGAVEQFNSASNASSSSNIAPEVPQPSEVTASASSSNQNHHCNGFANKASKNKHRKLYRFVLPPEYDAYDSRWTLKYPKNLPGLVELVPQSRVYVSYGDLMYCQQVSKDCKSLALRLLPVVFKTSALSVCSTMTETAQASKNVGSNIRPDLDDHACAVLLSFVLEHGLKCGWNTDLTPILSSLHRMLQELRFRFGVMAEC